MSANNKSDPEEHQRGGSWMQEEGKKDSWSQSRGCRNQGQIAEADWLWLPLNKKKKPGTKAGYRTINIVSSDTFSIKDKGTALQETNYKNNFFFILF